MSWRWSQPAIWHGKDARTLPDQRVSRTGPSANNDTFYDHLEFNEPFESFMDIVPSEYLLAVSAATMSWGDRENISDRIQAGPALRLVSLPRHAEHTNKPSPVNLCLRHRAVSLDTRSDQFEIPGRFYSRWLLNATAVLAFVKNLSLNVNKSRKTQI